MGKHIHFIGIGGISMSALAQIAKKNGDNVTGSDLAMSRQTDILKEKGIKVTIGHNLEDVEKADLIVFNSAIPDTDEEIMLAKKLNKQMLERSKYLGKIIKEYPYSIAVAGTHGKTTTTSMIASIFLEAKKDPSIQIGGFLKQIDSNYRVGDSDYLVFESCEYKESFLDFYSQTEVILNIDKDHLDYYKTFENVKKAFEKYALNITENGNLIANNEDENVRDLVAYVKEKRKDINIVTFGKGGDVDYDNLTYSMDGFNMTMNFDILNKGEKLGNISVNVIGEHNAKNALAAFATALVYNIGFNDIVKGLKAYVGTGRRFDYKGELNGAKIFDDYAHHPSEIETLLKSANNVKKGKVYVIFESHTFTRTKALKNEFAKALSLADVIYVSKIYPAREIDLKEISGKDIVDEMNKIENGKFKVSYIENWEDIADEIKSKVKSGDIILTVGAGNITNFSKLLLK